jgi:hypothetical protein
LTESPSWPNPGSKWNVLRNLRDKALDIHRSFEAKKNSTIDLAISDAIDWVADREFQRRNFQYGFWRRNAVGFNFDGFPDLEGFHRGLDMHG